MVRAPSEAFEETCRIDLTDERWNAMLSLPAGRRPAGGGNEMNAPKTTSREEATSAVIDALRHAAYMIEATLEWGSDGDVDSEVTTWCQDRDDLYAALQVLDPEGADAEMSIAAYAANTRVHGA